MDRSNSKPSHLGIPPTSRYVLPVVTPSATVLVESPFFLQPANDISSASKLSQIVEDSSDELAIFPLTKLPAELQLRVLWHCLVSSLPILNAGIPRDDQTALYNEEIRGQLRINPRIIFTCKAYHHEGIKLLYTNNHFSYTCEKLPPSWPTRVGKNLLLVKRLTIRLLCDTDSIFTHKAAVVPMYWLRSFKQLWTLRIDFCGTDVGYQYKWDEDHDSMSLLLESLNNIVVERRRANSSTNILSELLVTGLPESDIGLFVLKSMSMLLRPDGRIGIGTGSGGRSYVVDPEEYDFDEEQGYKILHDDRPRMYRVEAQIHWIHVQDVGALIQRAASDQSKWLFGNVGLVSEESD
ncbi:MAG: hypothetical protein Q9170_005244 [Blastenia crenularia]